MIGTLTNEFSFKILYFCVEISAPTTIIPTKAPSNRSKGKQNKKQDLHIGDYGVEEWKENGNLYLKSYKFNRKINKIV